MDDSEIKERLRLVRIRLAELHERERAGASSSPADEIEPPADQIAAPLETGDLGLPIGESPVPPDRDDDPVPFVVDPASAVVPDWEPVRPASLTAGPAADAGLSDGDLPPADNVTAGSADPAENADPVREENPAGDAGPASGAVWTSDSANVAESSGHDVVAGADVSEDQLQPVEDVAAVSTEPASATDSTPPRESRSGRSSTRPTGFTADEVAAILGGRKVPPPH
jgi:hypothetical protein